MKQIPDSSKSPYGWWVAYYVIRFEYYDEDKANLRRKCRAWKNTIILKARDREAAYKKALKEGKRNAGGEGYDATGKRKGTWKFEGLTSLIPIYERLEDLAEIYWTEDYPISVGQVKKMVCRKRELEAFDDAGKEG